MDFSIGEMAREASRFLEERVGDSANLAGDVLHLSQLLLDLLDEGSMLFLQLSARLCSIAASAIEARWKSSSLGDWSRS